MTEKRYYQKNYEEEYYIFDSNTISEDEFEERVEYEGYDVFADSLTGSEIIDLLNENEKLKKALLFYIDVSVCETSSNFYKDFDDICNNVFGCSYNEIKPLYSDISDEDDVFELFQR